MAGVPGSVKHVEFFAAEGERFAAFEDLEILRRHRLRFSEEAVQIVGPQAGGAGEELGRIDEVRGSFGVDVNAEARTFEYEGAGGAGVIEMNVSKQDGVKIGDGESAREQVSAEGFKGRGGAGIDDGVVSVGLEKSGSDGVRAAGPVKIQWRDGWHVKNGTGA
jgi:hypothetical protein